jgi:sodium/proline symporter
MENSFAITTTFIAYLVLMLAIGVIAYQRTKKTQATTFLAVVH